MDPTAITFGRGCLAEVGDHAKAMGLSRVAVMTDKRVGALELLDLVRRSLSAAKVDFEVYDEVKVEPTDQSFAAATEFAQAGRFDSYVSVGGGSVIDTAKAANLYATHPADFLAYVNQPIGEGRAVPGPVRPHIACPTTSGTGERVHRHRRVRSARAESEDRHRAQAPEADARADRSGRDGHAPGQRGRVPAASTCSPTRSSPSPARPFTARPAISATARPMSQGANPWSDVGCREALRLCGLYLERAVADASGPRRRGRT